MRYRTPLLASLVVVPAALVLAGCGGGGSTGGDGGTSASTGSPSAGSSSGAYQGGFEICSTGTVEEVASSYGVPEPTPDAVSDAIAEAVSGGTPRDAKDAKQGCLDAFEKSK